jgi:hypothetical protein
MFALKCTTIHTILTFVGLPILNGNVEWKCGQMIKLLNIHLNDHMQMDYEIGFQFILDVGQG